MPRLAALCEPQGEMRLLVHPSSDSFSLPIRSVSAPCANDDPRVSYRTLNHFLVARAVHSIARLEQVFGLRGAVGIQVYDSQPFVFPCLREANAATDCRIIGF